MTKELNDMHLFDMRQKRWIQFFEETASPLNKNKGTLNTFGGLTIGSKDGFSVDGSPSNKRGGATINNTSYSILRPITQGASSNSISPYKNFGKKNQSPNRSSLKNNSRN